jgi:hypothetical protein
MDGDIVRRVTITATSEGIDSTTRFVENLGNAISSVGESSDLSLGALAGGAGAVGPLATLAVEKLTIAFANFSFPPLIFQRAAQARGAYCDSEAF